MAWFKVDDGFLTSSKVMSIPREIRPEALGVWLAVGVWSAHEMKDGLVPDAVIRELGCSDQVKEILIAVGLWVLAERDAIYIHNWNDYQPTKEQLMAKADERHDKAVKAANARWSKDDAKPMPDDAKPMLDDAKAMLNDAPNPNPNPNQDKTNDQFDEFWNIWPRKEAKAKARTAYARAIKKIAEPDLLAKAREYVDNPYRPELTFVPHATSWLNGERWNDPLAGDMREKQVVDRFGRKIFYDENGIARGPNDWQQPDGRWVQG